jgi:hypothetical protein
VKRSILIIQTNSLSLDGMLNPIRSIGSFYSNEDTYRLPLKLAEIINKDAIT